MVDITQCSLIINPLGNVHCSEKESLSGAWLPAVW